MRSRCYDYKKCEVILMENKPVTAIIVGAGHRSMVYSKLALTKPSC